MQGTLRDVVENPIGSGADLDGLRRDLAAYAQELGARYYSYLLMKGGRGEETADADSLVTNYPAEWQARYQRKLYRFYDPVAVTTRASRLPFFWDDGAFLRRFRKDQRIVFHEARLFDIGAGYSIPIAGPRGDLGVFSIVTARRGDIEDVVLGAGGTLYLRALQMHDLMARRLFPAPAEADHGLSAREIECLRWTADGKTTEQIAHLTSISPATVNFHLKNATRKLDAANRHHAAIIAVRRGLI
ncbi:MAG: LuxR family transcriptional regulator [Pseudomonadota bacterium]